MKTTEPLPLLEEHVRPFLAADAAARLCINGKWFVGFLERFTFQNRPHLLGICPRACLNQRLDRDPGGTDRLIGDGDWAVGHSFADDHQPFLLDQAQFIGSDDGEALEVSFSNGAVLVLSKRPSDKEAVEKLLEKAC
ncbi:MAG: hypothetical protein KGI69_03305 [Patescibacteria group bacterium]|nr:hypothetical protein [Patescibacteria group bacterium]